MKTNRLESPRAPRTRWIMTGMGLALILFGLVCLHQVPNAEAIPPPKKPVCITDSITMDNIVFVNPSVLPGAASYRFTQFSTGFTFGGTGVVTMPNGVITLTDRESDRSVNAGLNTAQGTGSAAIYSIPIPGGATWVFRINQIIPNAPCGCGG